MQCAAQYVAVIIRLSFLVLAASVATGGVHAETLQGAVQEALETNPELGAIKFNRRAIDQELAAARGLRMPTVDVRVDGTRRITKESTGAGITTGSDWHWNKDASTVASQRIFDGFESHHEINRQKNRVESARWRVMDTANSIALRAVQAYLEVQRARAVLAAAKSNVAQHDALLRRVKARVSGGRGTSSDESEALTRTAQANALMIEAQNKVEDAGSLYRAVIGHAPHELAAPHAPLVALPKTVDSAVGEALEAAPSVLATLHDAEAAQDAIGSAYARLYPRLNVEASTDNAVSSLETGDHNIDARVMLVVRWNLLNGGIDKARVFESKSRALEAIEVSNNTKRIIERETRVSWSGLQSAQARVPQFKKQLETAVQTRSAYSQQFDGGQRRLLDLLNIQAEVFLAESSLRNEQLAATYNAYRILASVGRLVPAIGLELPPESVTPPAATIIDGWREGWSNER